MLKEKVVNMPAKLISVMVSILLMVGYLVGGPIFTPAAKAETLNDVGLNAPGRGLGTLPSGMSEDVRDMKLYAYVQKGETITWKFPTVDYGQATVGPDQQSALNLHVYNPSGALVYNDRSRNVIDGNTNRSRKTLQGSNVAPVTGVYVFHFLRPATGYPDKVRANWDVSVSGATGRVWSDHWHLSQERRWEDNTKPSNAFSNLDLYMVNESGAKYKLSYPKYQGVASSIQVDNLGFVNDQCEPLNKSLGAGVSYWDSYYKKRMCDGFSEYHLFTEPIDPTIPAYVENWGDGRSDSKWVNPAWEDTKISFDYNQTSPLSRAGTISLTSNADGPIDVTISGGGKSRVLTFYHPGAGDTETYTWDGKYSDGSAASARQSLSIRAEMNKRSPIYMSRMDVESSAGGIIVENLVGNGTSLLYWDDSDISPVGRTSVTSPIKNLNGVDSKAAGGVHRWNGDDSKPNEVVGGGGGTPGSWGNNSSIVDWTYLNAPAFDALMLSPTQAEGLPIISKTVDENGLFTMTISNPDSVNYVRSGVLYDIAQDIYGNELNPQLTLINPSAGTIDGNQWSYPELGPGVSYTVQAKVDLGQLVDLPDRTIKNYLCGEGYYSGNNTDYCENANFTLGVANTVAEWENPAVYSDVNFAVTGAQLWDNVSIPNEAPYKGGYTYVDLVTQDGSVIWTSSKMDITTVPTVLTTDKVTVSDPGTYTFIERTYAADDTLISQGKVGDPTETVTVSSSESQADLKVDKRALFSGEDIKPGAVVTYEIEVKNVATPQEGIITSAFDISARDVAVTGLGSISISNPTVGTANGSTWNIPRLDAGQSAVATVTATVLSDQDVREVSNAFYLDGLYDGELGTCQVNDGVDADTDMCDLETTKTPAKLAIDKKFINADGSDLTYEIEVANFGGTTATEVKVGDLSPDNSVNDITFANPSKGSIVSGEWMVGELAPDERATVTVTGKQNAEFWVVTNQAFVVSNGSIYTGEYEPNDSVETDTDQGDTVVTPLDKPDVRIDKSEPAQVLDKLEYIVTVQNFGPGKAEEVVVRDIPQSGITDITYSDETKGSASIEAGPVLVWNIGTLDSDESVTIKVTATVDPSADSVVNRAEVDVYGFDKPETCEPNDSVSEDTDRCDISSFTRDVNLKVDKLVDSTNTYAEGAEAVFTIEVKNSGSTFAQNVVVEDMPVAGLTDMSFGTPAVGTVDGLKWTLPYLGPGESQTITVQGISTGYSMENTVTVYGPNDDPVKDGDPNDDVDSDTDRFDRVTKELVSGVSIEKTAANANSDILNIGDMITWNYKVTNTGETPLTDISVTDNRGVIVTCETDSLSVGESVVCAGTGPISRTDG